ncbi:SCO7613 C-terminal domain-containing membrane protein [Nocardioides nanhaiensis]|uniref:DUF2157 domain-containing protein n=1 Tax=Nocardioides nanhaiensis TaxID=1476871 RepID=A0ABP8W570_9ACTN
MRRSTPLADPHRCPDCSATLTAALATTGGCPACGLPLQHPLGRELLATLSRADELLAQLRALAPAPTAASLAAPSPYPAASRPAPLPRRGLRPSSVPALLLGLGALCLLVAAVIFLAVAWSSLGVGGRTGVLLALTGAAAAGGVVLARRGLRVAGESLATVALGLLALDVLGAASAGWLPQQPAGATTTVLGSAVLVAGLAWSLAQPQLVAPQVLAGIALLTAWAGAMELTSGSLLVQAAGVVAGLGVVALGQHGRQGAARALAPTGLAVAMTTWALLTLHGLDAALAAPRLAALWSADGTGWRLLAAVALAGPALLVARTPVARVVVVALALVAAAATLTLPVVDEGTTAVALAALAVVLLGSAAAAALPRAWAAAPLAPAGIAAVPLVGVLLHLAAQAADAVLGAGPAFSAPLTAATAPALPVAHPALAVPGVLALGLLVVVAARALGLRRGLREVVTPSAALLGCTCAASLALTSGLLWPVVAALLVSGLGAVLVAGLVQRDLPWVGLVVLGLAVVVALPSAALTGVATTVAALAAVGLLVRPVAPRATAMAEAVLPLALGGAWWAWAEVGGLAVAGRGLPLLVLLGLLALARPRQECEVPAALVATLGALAAVGSADGVAGLGLATSLALHLTVAGALVVATSLLHDHRRRAAAPGGLLLAAATWVRLADLGVTAPEAYTLPTAAVLCLLAVLRLRSRDQAPSALLVPGLALATVPSLVWVLADPLSLRAALLGAACLGLVLLGLRLRWSAPLLVGALVGGAVVVRELAPYAAQTPQWVLIGAAGAVLTAVGVTWERRLGEVRAAAGVLDRLR